MAREAPEDPYAGLAPARSARSAASRPFLDSGDGVEPDPAGASRARAGGRESGARGRRRHQFERRRRERLGVDHRARDLGRLLGRLPGDRPRLLGSGDRRRGRRHAARPRLAQRAPSRRTSTTPRTSAAAPGSARWRGSTRRGPSPANIRCCSTRASRRPCSAIFPARSAARRSRARRASSRTGSAARVRARASPSSTIRCGCAACARGRSTAKGVRVSRQELVVGRHAQQLDRRKRFGAAARHRADRPCRARRRRRSRRKPEQSLHGRGQPQPRGAARGFSRSGAGHRADRPGRERRHRRL